MKTILDAETTLGHIDTLTPTTRVEFDFQASSSAFGALFRARDGTFALAITPSNAYITDEKQVAHINKPIELQIGKEYHVECGIKTNWTFNTYVLYVRIRQEQTARTCTPRKQSRVRMEVAQKRQNTYQDVLCRDTRQAHWRFFTKRRYRRASSAKRTRMIERALATDKAILKKDARGATMTHQFTQAAQNLLRAIDCPCFADENRAAVQQFLSRFAVHIIANIVPDDLQQSSRMKPIEQIVQDIADMPKEHQP